jgi:hypothetical protein
MHINSTKIPASQRGHIFFQKKCNPGVSGPDTKEHNSIIYKNY